MNWKKIIFWIVAPPIVFGSTAIYGLKAHVFWYLFSFVLVATDKEMRKQTLFSLFKKKNFNSHKVRKP